MKVLALGVLLVAVLVAVVLYPFDEVYDDERLEQSYLAWRRAHADLPRQVTLPESGVVRREFWVPCEESIHCHAWLFTDEHVTEQTPATRLVVIGHGFGAQKDMGLTRVAEYLISSDPRVAVIAFDYRTFGGSEGHPRHWVDPFRHVADWHAVLDHAQSDAFVRSFVDCSAGVVLHGTSYAGGHVLMVAHERQDRADTVPVLAVVSQVPSLSGLDAMQRARQTSSIGRSLRMAAATVRDVLRGVLGMPPSRIKVVGLHGELSFLQMSQEELAEYYGKHPATYLGGWMNMACARIGLTLPRYNPIEVVPALRASVLYIGAEQDHICPVEIIKQAYALTHDAVAEGQEAMAPEKDMLLMNCTHFGLYHGEVLHATLENTHLFFERAFDRATAR